MVNRSIKKIIARFIVLLEDSDIPVNNALLFGSYANGTARKDSDIDVAIISERFGHNRIKEGQLLFKKARLVDSRIEPIPVSLDDYQHDEDSPILYEIKKSGIELKHSRRKTKTSVKLSLKQPTFFSHSKTGEVSMLNISIKNDLIAQVNKLPYELQLKVLDFAKTLVPKGVKGKNLLQFEGAISADDLQLMSGAIEENCEKVDINEW